MSGGQFGGDEDRSDLNCQGEGRVSRVFFPAILLGHRSVAHDETCSAAHHRPERSRGIGCEGTFAASQVNQQNRKRRLVHLDAIPPRRSFQPHILRPVAIGVLRHVEIVEDAASVVGGAGREERSRAFNEVARPDEVVSTEILVSLGEAPRDRKARDDAAGKSFRLMRTQNRGAHGVQISRRRWRQRTQ